MESIFKIIFYDENNKRYNKKSFKERMKDIQSSYYLRKREERIKYQIEYNKRNKNKLRSYQRKYYMKIKKQI